jgi:hypothetical protein
MVLSRKLREDIMRKHGNIPALLFVSVITSLFLITISGDKAWAQGCSFELIKVVRGQDIGFDITFDDGNSVTEETLFNGESGETKWGGIFPDLLVTEDLPSGWQLGSISCFNDGVIITKLENGVKATCTEIEGQASCVFLNVGPDAIPTLSEWGMIAAAAGLAMIGVFFALRRKKIKAEL